MHPNCGFSIIKVRMYFINDFVSCVRVFVWLLPDENAFRGHIPMTGYCIFNDFSTNQIVSKRYECFRRLVGKFTGFVTPLISIFIAHKIWGIVWFLLCFIKLLHSSRSLCYFILTHFSPFPHSPLSTNSAFSLK